MGGDSLYAVVDQPLGSAPDARTYFLLLRQKKVAKEKATPGRCPACGGVPCATRLERGLRNSGFALRQCSPTSPLKPALLGTSQGDFNTDRSPPLSEFLQYAVTLRWFSGSPSCSVEQRSEAGENRRALFEGRSPELRPAGSALGVRSRPASRVAQGSRRSRPRNAGVAFFLATFSWRRKKKYARASGAEPSASETSPLEETTCSK